MSGEASLYRYDRAGRKQDIEQVTGQDEVKVDEISIRQNRLLEFCREPRSRKEMQEYIGIASRVHFSNNYLNPLLNEIKIIWERTREKL